MIIDSDKLPIKEMYEKHNPSNVIRYLDEEVCEYKCKNCEAKTDDPIAIGICCEITASTSKSD